MATNPIIKLLKKKFPKNDNNVNINISTNKSTTSNVINHSQSSPNKNKVNPGFLNFIKKVKIANSASKEKNLKKKSLSENIYNSLLFQKEQSKNYLEENDKEIKLGAQKGLLYLLNELSQGKFFPEINDFFDKMKDYKLEELRMKAKSPNKNEDNINNIKSEDDVETVKYDEVQNNNKYLTSIIQDETSENKNENKINKSETVTQTRKILKKKSSFKNKKHIKINPKSLSKKNVKENLDNLENLDNNS